MNRAAMYSHAPELERMTRQASEVIHISVTNLSHAGGRVSTLPPSDL